jgi:aconitate hydratase
MPARVLLQDFTGVPAWSTSPRCATPSRRSAATRTRINPLQPVDLVIDHSVQVDTSARGGALSLNTELEYERNRERYQFLRWGQARLRNFRVVPPGTGIVPPGEPRVPRAGRRLRGGRRGRLPRHARRHRLAHDDDQRPRRARLGRRAASRPRPRCSASRSRCSSPRSSASSSPASCPKARRRRTSCSRCTEMLRKKGSSASSSSSTARPRFARPRRPRDDREHGAGVRRDDGLLPGRRRDARLPAPHRPQREHQVKLVEAYTRAQGLFRTDATPDPVFTDTLELDLADGRAEPRRAEASAGPRRAHARRRTTPRRSRAEKERLAARPRTDGDAAKRRWSPRAARSRLVGGTAPRARASSSHGSVVIAAITSCTNTSNPSVMLAAGLVAQKAVERGALAPSRG